MSNLSEHYGIEEKDIEQAFINQMCLKKIKNMKIGQIMLE